MKLLLDKNLSHRLVPVLTQHGYEAVHVDDLDLSTADDEVILTWACDNGCVVVSSDTDFGDLLAAKRARAPSLVLTRAIASLAATRVHTCYLTIASFWITLR